MTSSFSAPQAVTAHSSDISMSEQDSLSLDEKLIQAYASSSIGAQAEQDYVIQRLSQRGVTSDPAELFRIQQLTSDYNLKISMISTLARKGVSTVETLLRS